MPDYNPYEWCQRHGWQEVRQLENGIWVAFPPGGVIETPLPQQLESTSVFIKNKRLQDFIDGLLLLAITAVTGSIILLMSPLFIFPKLRSYFNHLNLSLINLVEHLKFHQQ